MRNQLSHMAITCVLASACLAVSTSAQGPSAQSTTGQEANRNIVVEKPHYVTIPLEITVNRSAADVWKRIGGYCVISEWLQIATGCTILSGKDGEVGAVRSVANEILVAKTEFSYTYTQPVRAGQPYNLYHGTIEARPVTATTSKLLYTLMYDDSMLADDAAREKSKASRVATFTRALQNMKTLAEGGTLPPPPARGTAPAAPGR